MWCFETRWIGQELTEEEKDPIEALGETIPGTPGEDYPIFATPPETSFICDDKIQVDVQNRN